MTKETTTTAPYTPGVLDGDGWMIADVATSRHVAKCFNDESLGGPAAAIALAAELARRWNAFPALLAACEAALEDIDWLAQTVEREDQGERPSIVQLRSAIAAAKSQTGDAA